MLVLLFLEFSFVLYVLTFIRILCNQVFIFLSFLWPSTSYVILVNMWLYYLILLYNLGPLTIKARSTDFKFRMYGCLLYLQFGCLLRTFINQLDSWGAKFNLIFRNILPDSQERNRCDCYWRFLCCTLLSRNEKLDWIVAERYFRRPLFLT